MINRIVLTLSIIFVAACGGSDSGSSSQIDEIITETETIKKIEFGETYEFTLDSEDLSAFFTFHMITDYYYTVYLDYETEAKPEDSPYYIDCSFTSNPSRQDLTLDVNALTADGSMGNLEQFKWMGKKGAKQYSVSTSGDFQLSVKASELTDTTFQLKVVRHDPRGEPNNSIETSFPYARWSDHSPNRPPIAGIVKEGDEDWIAIDIYKNFIFMLSFHRLGEVTVQFFDSDQQPITEIFDFSHEASKAISFNRDYGLTYLKIAPKTYGTYVYTLLALEHCDPTSSSADPLCSYCPR